MTAFRMHVLVALALAGLAGGALGAPEEKPDPSAPKSEKDNSFAYDTYMRRHKYPLSIVLIETEGKDAKNVSMTLSVACGEGDYPAGQLAPVLDGKALPAQLNVLATWPKDGSIKHALVSFVLPAISAKQRLEVTFKKEAPTPPGKFEAAVDLRVFTARTEFAATQGEQTTTSSVPADTMARIAKVLAGELPAEEAKKIAPRLCGPLCYEFEILAPAQTGEKADPDIDVYYYLRFYSGQKGVRVAYVVENSRLPKKPYHEVTITDRAFKSLAFLAGLAGSAETLYQQGPVNHWYGTRYQVLRWWGEKPPAIYTKENLGYLVYSQFFPKLDLDHPMTPKEIEDAIAFRRISKPSADYPDGVPLSTGFLCPGMGSTGGRDEIGAMPYWYRLALASESPTLENFARVADGNSLAAFPVHMRPAENRQPGTYCDEPIRMMFDLSTRVNHVFVDGKGCRQYADSGHIPDTSYYTYLATGEKFYEEEMAFWSSSQLWTWAKKDSVEKDWHLPTHNRYSGWPLRNATNAAFVLPDSHPMKKYLHDFVQRTVEYQANLVKDPVKYWNAESRPSGGWQWFSGHCAFWQHCFFVWSLDNAARKGFYPVAAEARDGAADLLIRMYLCDEEFKAPDGKTYRNDPLQAIPYQMAIDVRAMDFTDPKNVKETFLRTLADNTGAIYYYTAVNEQNAYPQVTDELLAKLPKKIMQPEDWRFDPEITRKRDEVEVRKSLGNPGYHDEANGPTSAALARYDNPKAQKMYEFVRGLIEKAYGPNRIRGVEYVK